MNFWLIQLIGGIAYGALTISYYKKEKKKILFMQIIAYMMFTIHYYLLNGITGAICNLIGLLALLSLYFLDKYKVKKIIALIFILLIIVINIITFQNVFSIFPMIAATIVIVSFLTNNENIIRKIGVVSAICWLVYSIVYKSYVSIVFQGITLTGVFVAYVKNRKK